DLTVPRTMTECELEPLLARNVAYFGGQPAVEGAHHVADDLSCLLAGVGCHGHVKWEPSGAVHSLPPRPLRSARGVRASACPVDTGGPSSARPLRGLRASDTPGPRRPSLAPLGAGLL